MKYVFGILSLIIVAFVAIIAWENPSANIALSVPFLKLTIFTNSFIYVLGVFVVGFIAGIFCGCAFVVYQKDKMEPYKRQLEKMTVIKESNQSKVEVLEAKIKTLEVALKQSLENK